eukprot:jgi/Chrpa1/8407/Chrysochromulina_OHIO_Genome00003715-RA
MKAFQTAAIKHAQIEARGRLHASTAQGRVEATRATSNDLRTLRHIGTRAWADDSDFVPNRVRLAFAAFDHNRSGYLNYRELRSALRHYGLDVSNRDAQRMIVAYDERPDGRGPIGSVPVARRMELREFDQLVQDLESGVLRAAAAPSYDPANIPPRVFAAFRAHDANRDGYLDRTEMRHALLRYGIDSKQAGAARVLAGLERRPAGRIDIADFAKLVRQLESGERAAAREAVPARVRRTFEAFDKGGHGHLEVREIRAALRHYGLDVTKPSASSLLDAFDARPVGRLDVSEFAQLARGEPSSSRDIRMLEASLLTKLDGRAGTDSDMSRARVLTNLFGAVNPNGEQYASEAEFVSAIGRLSLGASPYAGVRSANPHMRIKSGWKFEVRPQTLTALFDKYAEQIGSERLVDVEALYARLKRAVTPYGRDATSLEIAELEMRSDLERELREHPHAPRGRAGGGGVLVGARDYISPSFYVGDRRNMPRQH